MTGTPCCVAFLITAAARRRIEVDDQQHRRARVEHLIGDRGELRLVTVGVLDVGLHARGLERLTQELAIRGLPTCRRRRVRQDHAHLRVGGFSGGLPAPAATAGRLVVIAAAGSDTERERADREGSGHPRGQLVRHVLPFLRFPQSWRLSANSKYL